MAQHFYVALMQELIVSTPNWFGLDNWDSEIFGSYEATWKSSLLTRFNQSFPKRTVAILPNYFHLPIENMSRLETVLAELSPVYDLLADEASKATLIKLISYKILGNNKVKMPVNTDSYWEQRKAAHAMANGAATIKINFNNWELRHFALNKIGYPIELYTLPGGVQIIFMLHQYEYGKTNPPIKARPGDYVIDGGGGWGDTALYFAHEVGPQGRVFTFEFTPENLEVFDRNLKLNPELAKRIAIFENALWDQSGEDCTYSPSGPATSLNSSKEGSLRTTTLSIDDLVKQEKLPKVDLIKMDIEGAELKALRGAEETIRTFKPKLAISVYHKPHDIAEIPLYLNNLDLGYEFFLDHFTIYEGETVLFANPTR